MFRLASILFGLVGSTLAGIGLTVVVTVPALADQAMKWIPIAIAAGFVLAAPLSFVIAGRILAQTRGKVSSPL